MIWAVASRSKFYNFGQSRLIFILRFFFLLRILHIVCPYAKHSYEEQLKVLGCSMKWLYKNLGCLLNWIDRYFWKRCSDPMFTPKTILKWRLPVLYQSPPTIINRVIECLDKSNFGLLDLFFDPLELWCMYYTRDDILGNWKCFYKLSFDSFSVERKRHGCVCAPINRRYAKESYSMYNFFFFIILMYIYILTHFRVC